MTNNSTKLTIEDWIDKERATSYIKRIKEEETIKRNMPRLTKNQFNEIRNRNNLIYGIAYYITIIGIISLSYGITLKLTDNLFSQIGFIMILIGGISLIILPIIGLKEMSWVR